MRHSSAQNVWSGLAVVTLAVTAGCSSQEAPLPEDSLAGELQVERTVEDGVEVVRNLSGSKWGGNATLAVELEIGIDEGDERYMFGNPYPFWITDEEIFVMEGGDGMVRVYGRDGEHRRDFGSLGEGPGEFSRGAQMTMNTSGQLAITMGSGNSVRTAFYTPDGEFLHEWRTQGNPGDRTYIVPVNPVPLDDSVLTRVMRMPEADSLDATDRETGFVRFDGDGYIGEPWFAPQSSFVPETMSFTFSAQGRDFTRQLPVPWTPRMVAAGAYDGSMIWSHADAYRFQIERPDGTQLAVERVAEQIAVDPGEAEYQRRSMVATMRQRTPDFDWDGSGTPDFKPWLRSIIADPTGRIWVSREGVARRVEPCDEDPLALEQGERPVRCWETESLLDVFNSDGEFLGSLERPHGLVLLGPLINGTHMVAGYEDDFGVGKVRVYRILLPGDKIES
ncbi:MAG: hypothetical protein GKS06_10785 [Acidobacteria bacterium]|nr:hypothetical protein [Acidobacteriota bacterium]